MPISRSDSQKLIEAHTRISIAMEGIQDNLKKLNDSNILHIQESRTAYIDQSANHKSVIDHLQLMTQKYWWLIIALIMILAALAGYKEIIKLPTI